MDEKAKEDVRKLVSDGTPHEQIKSYMASLGYNDQDIEKEINILHAESLAAYETNLGNSNKNSAKMRFISPRTVINSFQNFVIGAAIIILLLRLSVINLLFLIGLITLLAKDKFAAFALSLFALLLSLLFFILALLI